MRIGLFGGTFNPIHNGHLRAANDVLRGANLKKIIFVPSYIPPHRDPDMDTPAEKRLEAVRLAVAENPCFEASSFEVDARGKSYSINTIKHYASIFKTTPYFIIGQDSFNEIMSWYRARTLFVFTHFIVISRPGSIRLELKEIMGSYASKFIRTPTGYANMLGKEIIFLDIEPNDISSSDIREHVKAGRPVTGLVPESVEKYIHDERMYE